LRYADDLGPRGGLSLGWAIPARAGFRHCVPE
jgi:hypothetical protein